MAEEEQSLAVRDEPKAVDEYERQYMQGHGAVLHRTKRPAPKWLQVALASSGISGLAMLFTPAWVAGLVLIPMGIFLWALFSVLRFTISERAVVVQYGLFGPTIPIESIESAEAVDYDWKKFGGWGIRRSLDGEWMYNMPGDGGRALRIVWTDKHGERRITGIGMPAPEPAAAAIAQARRALPSVREPEALPGDGA
jgi:hypothetical protein